jgi:hypothetical protein
MTKPKQVKYPLAWDRIGNIRPTPEEILEINRMTEKDKTRELLKVFLMLRKRGESRKIIMGLCAIGDRAYEQVNIMVAASEFLTSQISVANKYLVKDTAADGGIDAALEGEFVVRTIDDAPAIMEEKIIKLLDAMTDSKIADATLDEIANTIGKVIDKYRTMTGQSNFNMAIGISQGKESKALDDQKLKLLLEQADKLERALNALAAREDKAKAIGPAGTGTGPDIDDTGTRPTP